MGINTITDMEILDETHQQRGGGIRVRLTYVAEVFVINTQTARAVDQDRDAFAYPLGASLEDITEGPHTTLQFVSEDPFDRAELVHMVRKIVEIDNAFSAIKHETKPGGASNE